MSKLYYLGTGTEFIKTQCKEYKTPEGALKAAAKDDDLVVWDEDGTVIGSLTDVVPEGALDENPDSENAQAGTESENEQQVTNTPSNAENSQNEANTTSENQNDEDAAGTSNKDDEDDITPVTGTVIATVICEGTLNLRRSPSFKAGNECGRASKGQKYHVKALHDVSGRAIVETIDGIFFSGEKNHVSIESMEE